MKHLLLSLFTLLTIVAFSQDKPAYKIYTANGKKVKYKKMVKTLSKEDVVLFGELHNSAIAHWLQLELTQDLDKNRNLILGAEMFEADNQDELNLYLADSINTKALDTLARLWPNHDTDYAPLLNYAKANGLEFIATNIPRRFASMVYKKGGFGALDTLSEEQKSWIAPLPITFDPELPQYQAVLKMMGGHGSESLVMAQAIKDATMAYFILQNWKQGELFVHYNGAFHSDFYEGIMWYLLLAKPELNCGTISTVTQVDISKLEKEYKGKADFIIVVDENVTTTY
jgi:uncharacterized iron-regulated protein